MLGRLLAEWNDKPAGCLFLLPLWNPVLVAEQVGTLAAIARGRFIFQCGLGADEAQFLAMGANIKQRPSAFEESFGLVKRMLAGETVSSQGRFVVEHARVAPRPAEPVEYWIGARPRVSIDRAARIADGWLAIPGLTFEKERAQAAWYLEGSAKYGETPTAVATRRISSASPGRGRLVRKARWSGRVSPASDPAAPSGDQSRWEKFRAAQKSAKLLTDVIVRRHDERSREGAGFPRPSRRGSQGAPLGLSAQGLREPRSPAATRAS
jgi:alkanesulfonate monooxygenase SsuD/methylene tetrahydromethanopterin reductase-like flavin-dependent oxidoreductase (luciferase family)